jgi:hypothetical protein
MVLVHRLEALNILLELWAEAYNSLLLLVCSSRKYSCSS